MVLIINKMLQTRVSEDQDVACRCIVSANNVDVFYHNITDKHVN